MIFDNQLRHAAAIIASYQGESPLHGWLKNFFREHKQMGSKDRRQLSQLVYGFYRLGHAVKGIPVEERILTGLFLCHEDNNNLLKHFKPEWDRHIDLPVGKKIALCRASGIDFRPTEIFPWKEELSEGIDHETLCLSFLRQPDLFLRIRPGHEQEVLAKIAERLPQDPQTAHSQPPAAYGFIPPSTLRFPNGFAVEDLFTPDKEVVIQDYSSQRISPFLQLSKDPSVTPVTGSGRLSFWDACAASGGKSILVHDLNPDAKLTVSDIRDSILNNLRKRFRQAGITHYHSFTVDLTTAQPQHVSLKDMGARYDAILADVPCSGSGTWSRTPEELYFFDPSKINTYRERQQKIISQLVPRMVKEASLIYCTCSVFKKENEEMTAFIRQSFGLKTDRQEMITGYSEKADSMFAARFRQL
jgi:16S rRNA (cytosine967-C5)-methyltransferase